ncbi:MAG: hypothetical protein AAFV07_13965, partial [Bacteroidota bacterium]
HALAWQTGILTFRNQSFQDVKALLEAQYGTEVQLHHERESDWEPAWSVREEHFQTPEREIRVMLFLYYQPDSDLLTVRGLHLHSPAVA